MKWVQAIPNKVAAALWLLVVLGLLFWSNYRERQNTHRLSASLATIYEDRLVVEGYIYQYAENLHQIGHILAETAYGNTQKTELSLTLVQRLRQLEVAYRATRLTPEEARQFEHFDSLCYQMADMLEKGQLPDAAALNREALSILDRLSDIQLEEASREVALAEAMLQKSVLSNTFEMAVLLVVALIIQALILTARPVRLPVFPRDPNLN